MKIIILGGGFSGLSICWHLLNESNGGVSVDLYDPVPIGEGTSGLSAGLLHPFTGKHARMPKYAKRGLFETHKLLTAAQNALNKHLILSQGLLRPTCDTDQIKSFSKALKNYPKKLALWSQEECNEKVNGLKWIENGFGLWIKEALTINVKGYLQGLWQSCSQLGAQFFQDKVIEKSKLEKTEALVFACGADLTSFPFFKDFPIERVKGQSLTIQFPEHIDPLPFGLNGLGYLVIGEKKHTYIAGTTFEHHFEDNKPDLKFASKEILDKISAFFPPIKSATVLSCHAGIRATTPTKLPFLGRYKQKSWFMTGLGSKGLLHHSILGKYLARAILVQNPDLIPSDVRYHFDTAS